MKVGLEETLAATMMRTGAKIVALKTGLIDVPKSMCYVPQLQEFCLFGILSNLKTQFIQSNACAGPCRNSVKS